MTETPDKSLRRGWTTGACATAAAKAAYQALLSGAFPDPVTITLPGGQQPAFALAREALAANSASAAVIKDAGDDPDVTHLAEIEASVRLGDAGSGITFRAGEGVGTVTLPGLPLEVGEPAINPVPRRMIAQALDEVAHDHGGVGDIEVTVSVAGGEELAERTWNPRLGILGGISILGTTGIVVPFSCAAWIHSIHRGIDVARAVGHGHVAAATGRTSEAGLRTVHDLPDTAMIDMGDFAGGMLKYLRDHPLPRLSIGGGFAKLSKLAAGALDLHSSRSRVDTGWLAAAVAELGAAAEVVEFIRNANTAKEARDIALRHGLDLADVVARQARETALATLSGGTEVEIIVFDRSGAMIGRAGGWPS